MASIDDVLKAKAIDSWTLTGPGALVKVRSTQAALAVQKSGKVEGYVTQAKYLKGLNSNQIQRDLGLPPGSGKSGVVVFWLARIPRPAEFENRFFTSWPGGLPWTDKDSEAFWSARDRVPLAPTEDINAYPPGSLKIPQWELMVQLPLSGMRRQVTPSMPFDL